MNRIIMGLTLAGLMLAPGMLQAQNRVEGSRPGETYRVGESAPQQAAPQVQPGQQQPQYQMNPQVSPQELERQVEGKDRAGQAGAGKPVIMEFSDLQCPDSARYNANLKQQVMQRYVSSGRASYEWHDFPLPSHEQAPEAAAAARCAGQAADSVRQQIMANQGQMSTNVFTGYARQAGVDTDQFASCMRAGRTMREVMNDKALGESMGVRGTPTLVVANRDASGQLRPVRVIKAYNPPQQVLAEIDSALGGGAQPAASGQSMAPGYPPAGQQQLPVSQPAY